MNRHYISRFVLMIVLLLGVCAKGWADGERILLEDDFTYLPPGQGANSIITNPYGDWNLESCADIPAIPGVLKVLSAGIVTTPTFTNSPINAVLTFKCASATNNKATFMVSTNNSASIVVGNTYYNDGFQIETNKNVSNMETKQLTITNATNNTRIIISYVNGTFLLDDVKIVASTIPISEASDNTDVIEVQKGNTVDVTLGRTFPANTWCTLCLPFDVTASSIGTACGQTEEPQLRVFSGVEGKTMKFTAPENDAVSAGTPFLLKFTTAVTSNPLFSGVTISKTGDAVTPAARVAHEGYEDYSFIGTYSPVSIDPAGWFLKADGKLYQPGLETVGGNVNRTLPGLRAYFTLPTTTSGSRPVVSIADDNATTVGTAGSTAPSVEAIYTLGGLPVASPKSPGIYLVRHTDGSTQKVTIR